MYGDIINFIFVVFTSVVYAMIEIELEAKEGWMKNIPTANIIWFGNKYMTLYHIYMIVLMFFTFVFQNQMIFTLSSILYTLSNMILFLFLEDTLWFILNPYFTIDKYTKKDIWWHASQPWILGIPLHNYIISTVMVLIWLITGNNYVIINLLLSYMVLLISIPLSKYYHKFYLYCHNDNIKKIKN